MDPAEKRAEEVLFGSMARMAADGIEDGRMDQAARDRMMLNNREMVETMLGAHPDAVFAGDGRGMMDTLTTAMQRRNVVECPHFSDTLFAGGMVSVNLGRREAVCPQCYEPAAPADDDGCCDICNEPTEAFHQFDLIAWMIYYHADVCGDCAAHIDSLSSKGE